MGTEKSAMLAVFKMDKKMSTAEWRERFLEAYPVMRDMPGIFSKCWWCDQEKGVWGSFYIFNSEKELKEYITSDLWVNFVPAKFDCKPEVTIVEPALILSKKVVTTGESSWMTE